MTLMPIDFFQCPFSNFVVFLKVELVVKRLATKVCTNCGGSAREHSRIFAGNLPGLCRNFAGTLPAFCRDFARILPGLCRELPGLCWIYPRVFPIVARFHWNFCRILPDSCESFAGLLPDHLFTRTHFHVTSAWDDTLHMCPLENCIALCPTSTPPLHHLLPHPRQISAITLAPPLPHPLPCDCM